MSMKYSDTEYRCKYCGEYVLRHKICEQCIIDKLYEAWASGKEPSRSMLTLAYRRGIKPIEIREEAREDAKGRIKDNSRRGTSTVLSR